MLTQQRHEIILKLLKEKGSITVTEVRDLLDTSESTVRRDITALDKEGKLEKVFGGAVPRNFFPAVEKGLQESYTKGVLAGFPVVGVKAILVDGSYHPVDSSEMSFKTAASLAYKEGMKQAEPTLLEPVGLMSVTVPDECTGDIMGDLNKRRGRVLGMNSVEDQGMTFISAEVPLREMADYALQLRQMTQGEGIFSMAFARYEQLPANLVAEVIASASE